MANYQPFSSRISHSARLSFSDFFRYRIPCSGYLLFFSRQYKPQLAGGHKVVPPGSHRPRFTVDQLNVLRQNLWNPDHPHIPYPRHPHQRPSYFGQEKKKTPKKFSSCPVFFGGLMVQHLGHLGAEMQESSCPTRKWCPGAAKNCYTLLHLEMGFIKAIPSKAVMVCVQLDFLKNPSGYVKIATAWP